MTPNINISINILNKIKTANKILLVTHENPDGDALASICLMIELLESLNKKYLAYCYDTPPFQFDFLPHIEKITNNKIKISDFDLIITLDCGNISRTKLADEINNRNKDQFVIEFDHHIKTENGSDLELRDPAASSTTEVIYDFLKINKIRINKNSANCILTGILTDTANFLYPSTSTKTVKIASEMLALGANLSQITENTWRNQSIESMKIWGKVMSRLKINPKYNFAFSVLTLSDITDSNVSEEELEGIAGFISNLHNVNGIMLLKERSDGTIKGSLRTSKHNIDVSKLAQALGGGGHAKASGFKIEGKLRKVDDGWRVI